VPSQAGLRTTAASRRHPAGRCRALRASRSGHSPRAGEQHVGYRRPRRVAASPDALRRSRPPGSRPAQRQAPSAPAPALGARRQSRLLERRSEQPRSAQPQGNDRRGDVDARHAVAARPPDVGRRRHRRRGRHRRYSHRRVAATMRARSSLDGLRRCLHDVAGDFQPTLDQFGRRRGDEAGGRAAEQARR
jgi:hypothetical protein